MEYEFILPSGISVRVSEREIAEIVTTGISNRPYWQYCGFIEPQEVYDFLSRKLSDKKKLEKIAYYILFYAENVVFSVYANIKGNQSDLDALQYKEFMMPLLVELRKMYKQVQQANSVDEIYNIIDKMIAKCLSYCVDPF